MKKYCCYIGAALLGSLFIYLFYRTEYTVVNVLLGKLTEGALLPAVQWVQLHIPLPEFVIYSLPEGLWVFAATLVSKHLYCVAGGMHIRLAWLPLSYAVILELLQLAHYMPGRFDSADLLCAAALSIWALKKIDCPLPYQDFFREFNMRSLSLLGTYGIVFLSHVNRH